jgi:hypothetical protein
MIADGKRKNNRYFVHREFLKLFRADMEEQERERISPPGNFAAESEGRFGIRRV